ncbi:MAG: sigma-70 family RNA polymerase sigma factor [Armatimonadetes bacterium]|nr:sigma-70 family RNA polymerase sigma factor [Armatimonadota bacterium]
MERVTGRPPDRENREVTATDAVSPGEAADQLLKSIGAFKRGTGMWSRRREREVRARETSWDEWIEAEMVDLGSVDLWDEMDEVARVCLLSPSEKAVLAMSRLEEWSLRQIARHLRITVYRVRQLLGSALAKCSAVSEAPCSPRALFWEEVREKWRLVYRAPHRPWWKPGGQRRSEGDG